MADVRGGGSQVRLAPIYDRIRTWSPSEGTRVVRACAVCTHVHECLYDRDVKAWMCDDCAAYVADDNPWSATEMCTVGMTDENEMEPY